MAKKKPGINKEGFDALRMAAEAGQRRRVFIRSLLNILERYGFPIDQFRSGACDPDSIRSIAELIGVSAEELDDDLLVYLPPKVEAWAINWAAEQKLKAEDDTRWSKPKTLDHWGKVFGNISVDTMRKRLEEKGTRYKKFGNLFMIDLRDIPEAAKDADNRR